MQQNTDRILTTHVGSLARPHQILDMIQARIKGEPVDEAEFSAALRKGVDDLVRQQVECGIDIVSDGELSKTGFLSYVRRRVSGFEPSTEGAPIATGRFYATRESEAFPEYYAWYEAQRSEQGAVAEQRELLLCTGPITYTGMPELQRDIDNLKAAMQANGAKFGFMPALAPIAPGGNAYYSTEEEFSQALGDALREEYKAIIDAGLILQIDDPSFATMYGHGPTSIEDRRRDAERKVEVLNYALKGLPPENIRFHTCYSINMGPRVYDAPLRDFLDLMLKINTAGYSYEVGNARHAHEWRVWEDVKLPEGKVIIPGVISHTTALVEHPQWIADQLVLHADLVGKERVLAGADCGFSSNAAYNAEIHPTVVWAKFQAMAEGARLATQRLWGK
jgi:5-methyltetrahydropteroyltriglutamate--homocysteine methyltransferase